MLEGPSGTGRSQAITAILADRTAQDRRVLFVAREGATLDVVRRRLGEVGLLPLALDPQDESARPEQVRARLRTALVSAHGYRVAALDVEATGSVPGQCAVRLHQRSAAAQGHYTAHAQRLAAGTGPNLAVPPAGLDDTDVAPGDPRPLAVTARRAVAAAVPLLASLPSDGLPP